MDLRFALRTLRRTPAFSFLAIAILALGIGANTAIFSVVNAVILRPLNYRDPARLVSLSTAWEKGSRYGQVSGPDFLDYQKQSAVFESLAAYSAGTASIVVGSHAEFIGAAEVSSEFFHTLGVQPIAGRFPSTTEWKTKPHVALVSAGFWQRHFGNRPFTGGKIVRDWTGAVEIIGVLPYGFHFPEESATEIWAPFSDSLANTNRGGHNYRVIGRLQPGITLAQAQAQLTAVAARLEKAYPGTNKNTSAFLTQLVDFNVRNVKTSLYVLLASVALVLLIACANVANLVLARGAGRVRELAIRSALGAGQSRIVHQLFIESLVLAAAASLVGVLLAKAILPILLTAAPKFVPRLDQVAIDLPVLLFCIACGFAASLLFGLVPAFQASRVDPSRNLHQGGSRTIIGGTTGFLRTTFVAAEIALCAVLLVSAGLLLKSFFAMTSVNLGFHPERLLVAQISVPSSGDHPNEVLYKPLLDRLNNTPQIQSATLTRTLPGEAETRSNGVYVVTGQTMNDMKAGGPEAGFSVISSDYFRTLSIPLISGRAFSDRDDAKAPLVAIISESLVRRSFPNVDPVGQNILCGLDLKSMNWMKIVGIVSDVHMDGPTQPPAAEIYVPYLQHPRQDFRLLVKAGPSPLAFAETVRRDIRTLDPEASVKLTTMENHLATVVSTPRFSSELVSVFAALAMLLAVIGIYGVMSYSVSQRTAEIGLRFALGAGRKEILSMILSQALKLTVIGLLAGTIGAMAATRILKSQLFEVSPADPATYLATLALLAAVALIAAYLPAWRASRVEPLEALRQE